MGQSLYNITSIISTILIIATIIGGFLAMRSGLSKATSELAKNASDYQAQAISALQAEIALLRAKYEDIHHENLKLQGTIATICEALKARGIAISIDGSMVNIHDQAGSTTARIQEQEAGTRTPLQFRNPKSSAGITEVQ